MSTIVTRAGKGSPLTHAEVDANFTNLNSDKIESGNTVSSLNILSANIDGGTVDNTVVGGSTPAAGTFTTLTGNSTSQFGRSSANYIQATGSTTTNSPEISALGSDTNIPLTLESKGTGAINLAVGSRGVNVSNGMTVTAITRTAGGNGYSFPITVTISAPTTAGGVTATASLTSVGAGNATVASGGTGYTLNDTLTVVGGTPTGSAATYTVTGVSGGVITSVTSLAGNSYSTPPSNPVSVTGGTGSSATLNLTYFVPSGAFNITNAGSGYVEQPTVTFSGGGGSGAAAYATVGSSTTIRHLTNFMSFTGASGISFAVNSSTNTAVNYLQAGSQSSGNFPNIAAVGSDTNIGIDVFPKGTSPFRVRTNAADEQFRVAHTASAVNYVQVTGGASGDPANVTISAQGSSTNCGIKIAGKGTGLISLEPNSGSPRFTVQNNSAQTDIAIAANGNPALRATNTANQVNWFTLTGSIASSGPILSAAGSDTNIDLNLTTKGTGAVRFNTGSGEQFRVADLGGTADSYIQAKGGSSATAGVYLSVGGAARNLYISNGAGSNTRFFTNGEGSAEQLRIAHTASAVNYVQVTGGPTTGAPSFSFTGSDSTVSGFITVKGAGAFSFFNNGASSSRIFRMDGSASTSLANYLQVAGTVAGTAPVLSAQGSDTNIDLTLTPKGTGLVQFGTRTASADAAITGYIEIKDSGGTIRRLAIIG